MSSRLHIALPSFLGGFYTLVSLFTHLKALYLEEIFPEPPTFSLEESIHFQTLSNSPNLSYHLRRHHATQLHYQLSSSSPYTVKSYESDFVTSTIVSTNSLPSGTEVIMDTGSNLALLPLSSSQPSLASFRPLDSLESESFKHIAFNYYFRCPTLVSKNYYCSKELYGSDGTNTIIGSEILNFSSDQSNSNLNLEDNQGTRTITQYRLNNLYGFHVSLGIIGLSFNSKKFKSNSFLSSLKVNKQNLAMESKYKTENEEKKIFTDIKIGIEEDYSANTKFQEFGVSLAMFSLMNVFGIEAFDGNSNYEAVKPKKAGLANYLNTFSNQKVFEDGVDMSFPAIFDSGTSIVIFPKKFAEKFIKSLRNFPGKVLVAKIRAEIVHKICWVKNSGIKYAVKLENLTLVADLDFMKSSEEKSASGVDYNCMMFYAMDQPPTALGFPLWKAFNVMWDADAKGMRFGKGEMCQNNECDVLENK